MSTLRRWLELGHCLDHLEVILYKPSLDEHALRRMDEGSQVRHKAVREHFGEKLPQEMNLQIGL
jgi:hypothetical protein